MTRWWPKWLTIAIPVLLLSGLVVGVNVGHERALSPIDEFVYIDYVDKIPTDGVVRPGQKLGKLTRTAIACRGFIRYGQLRGMNCEPLRIGNDRFFPNGAVNSGDVYTPIFPALTFAGYWLIHRLGVDDPVDAMRLAGIFWMAATLACLALAARELGLSRRTTAGVLLVLAGSMPAIGAFTFVSSDAVTLFGGAALLWLTLRLDRRGRGWWLLGIVATLLVLAKIQNLGIVGTVLIYVLLRDARRLREDPSTAKLLAPGRRLKGALTVVAFGGVPVVLYAIWLKVRLLWSVGSGGSHGLGEPFNVGRLLAEAGRFFSVAEGSMDPLLFGYSAMLLAVVVGNLVIAGPIAAILTERSATRTRDLAWATLVGMVVSPVALVLMTYLVVHEYVPLVPRYGYPMLPAALLCFGLLADRRRWSSWLTVGMGAGVVGIACLAMT